MRQEEGKICSIDDVQQRNELMKGEQEFSCGICCATSDDRSKLCDPVNTSSNLFCKDFSGN
jgi:hypothetical protein